MPKVILKGHIQVLEADYPTVVAELETHKKLTLAETGCLVFQVTPSKLQFGRFDVYEEFVDRQAFDHHQARVKSSNWGQISANVERFYEVFEGN